jgi:hypothetical protein
LELLSVLWYGLNAINPIIYLLSLPKLRISATKFFQGLFKKTKILKKSIVQLRNVVSAPALLSSNQEPETGIKKKSVTDQHDQQGKTAICIEMQRQE